MYSLSNSRPILILYEVKKTDWVVSTPCSEKNTHLQLSFISSFWSSSREKCRQRADRIINILSYEQSARDYGYLRRATRPLIIHIISLSSCDVAMTVAANG